MPTGTILVTPKGTAPGADRTTRGRKAAVYEGIADLHFDGMGKPRGDTTVIVREREIGDLGHGGLPLRGYRASRA